MVIASSGPVSFGSYFTEIGRATEQISYSFVYANMFAYTPIAGCNVTLGVLRGSVDPKKKVEYSGRNLTGTNGSIVTSWTSPLPGAATGVNNPTLTVDTGSNMRYVSFNRASSHNFTVPSVSFTFQNGATYINGLTILLIARRSTTAGTWERFFDFGSGAAANNILVARPGLSANVITCEIFNNSSYSVSDYVTVPDGSWFYLAIVINNTVSPVTVNFYVNGVATTSSVQNAGRNLANLIDRTIASNFIAKSNWADSLFSGDIAEFYIYNNAFGTNQLNEFAKFFKNLYPLINITTT